MGLCFFTSDLHGRTARYETLFARIRAEQPSGVFLGGDLLPHVMDRSWAEGSVDSHFVDGYLAPSFAALRDEMGSAYPRVFAILGNDDPYAMAEDMQAGQARGLWEYVHGRGVPFGRWTVYGYNCVPPTPFQRKDWERYDVSRFVDPGCTGPEDGRRGDDLTDRELRIRTIRHELAELVGDADLGSAILLMHSPPYDTALDHAGLDGKFVDHVPLDPHVGSIAIRELIEKRGPLLSLHGHVHESTARTGSWREKLGETWAFNGAHAGPELPLVRFDPTDPEAASRELI